MLTDKTFTTTLTWDELQALREVDDLRQQNAKQFALIADLERQIAVLDLEVRRLEDDNLRLLNENSALRARIAELEAPVVVPDAEVTPAPVPAPVITKTDLKHIAGVTITLDAAPSERKDAAARELIKLAADTGFNTVRFLRNFEEAVQDNGRMDAARNVSGFAKSLGLMVVYDTVELVVRRINSEPMTDDARREKIERYFAALKAHGSALYINDANRDDLKADLPGIVAQIRTASDLPLIASLTATADLDTYRKLFDHIEIQTFGTLDEFARYKAIPMSILCIDGQHDASNRYLREMLDMVGYRSFFVYTMYDRRTDWRNMPDTVDIYRVFLQKWKAQRG